MAELRMNLNQLNSNTDQANEAHVNYLAYATCRHSVFISKDHIQACINVF